MSKPDTIPFFSFFSILLNLYLVCWQHSINSNGFLRALHFNIHASLFQAVIIEAVSFF